MTTQVEFQPTLLGLGEPSIAGWDGVERLQLDDACWADHRAGWLAGSDELFADLVSRLDWEHHRRPMYDRMVDVPRLTAFGPLATAEMPPIVSEIAALLGSRYGRPFDSVGCNLYRDGRDSVAWHGDKVGRKYKDPMVAIVSLGEARPFLLRPVGGGGSRKFRLGGGDLLVMGGACQHRWEHCVPKVAHSGPRLSVTLRHGDDRYEQ